MNKMKSTNKTLLCMVALLPSVAFGADSPQRGMPAVILPRLYSRDVAEGRRVLSASQFSVDSLSPDGFVGVEKKKRRNVTYLSLQPNSSFSRSLRGNISDSIAVSFLVLASENTVVEIAGARIGLTASVVADNLQLMYDDVSSGTPEWKSLGIYLPIQSFDVHGLGSPSVLTVFVNPRSGVWHLYSGNRLWADNLPLLAVKDQNRTFSIKTGKGAAWLCDLVQADENPLFVDDNDNGVDDAFEKKSRGRVLDNNSGAPERKALAAQWRAAQKVDFPAILFVTRPLPDSK
jgi:hypothetical protein